MLQHVLDWLAGHFWVAWACLLVVVDVQKMPDSISMLIKQCEQVYWSSGRSTQYSSYLDAGCDQLAGCQHSVALAPEPHSYTLHQDDVKGP